MPLQYTLDPFVDSALSGLFINDPCNLPSEKIEDIEKLTLRMVYSAFVTYASDAKKIFALSPDDEKDIAEDITREIFNRFSGYPAEARVWSKVDFKRSQWVTLPEHMIRQSLLVDSKAEKNRPDNARLQVGQTSMCIKQIRDHQRIEVPGTLPKCMVLDGKKYLTTTILTVYHYHKDKDPYYVSAVGEDQVYRKLEEIVFCAIPNGLLQDEYNPSCEDSIWNVGPDSPTRGEEFRTRVSFSKLKRKSAWRVQKIKWLNPEREEITAVWSQ
jgi:hypothetical protein